MILFLVENSILSERSFHLRAFFTEYFEELKILAMKSVACFLWSIKDKITVFPKGQLCLNAHKSSLSSLDTSSSEFWLLEFSTYEINSSLCPGAIASTYVCFKRAVASWNFYKR